MLYSLLVEPPSHSVSTPAGDIHEALVLLGAGLGKHLSLDDGPTVIARYLLDEWPEYETGHFADHHIPVFASLLPPPPSTFSVQTG